MITNKLTRGNTFIDSNNEIAVFYELQENNIVSIITKEKIINLSQDDFTNQFEYAKLVNFFFINDKVEITILTDMIITSMNGNDVEIKAGKYLNQINDIYTKELSGMCYVDKRFYVFDFDTSGRDYVEYICDCKNLKLSE